MEKMQARLSLPAFFLYRYRSLITVVLDSVLEVEELPRKRATKMMIKTAAPAIQTHGEVYHSVVLVVVVDVVFSVTFSFVPCAHMAICMPVNRINMKNF
jgi:hypothetical protein